jgi:hypothetical protein
MAARLIWNERVLIIKIDGVHRSAVGCIVWLGVSVASSCRLDQSDICNLAWPHAVATKSSKTKLIRDVLAENRMRLIAKGADDSNHSVFDSARLGNHRRSLRMIPRIPNHGVKPNRVRSKFLSVCAFLASYKAAILGAGPIIARHIDSLSGELLRTVEQLLNRNFCWRRLGCDE